MNRFIEEQKQIEEMMINETDLERVQRMKNVIKDIKTFQNRMKQLALEWDDNPAREIDIDDLHNEFTIFQDCYQEYINNDCDYSDSEDE